MGMILNSIEQLSTLEYKLDKMTQLKRLEKSALLFEKIVTVHFSYNFKRFRSDGNTWEISQAFKA